MPSVTVPTVLGPLAIGRTAQRIRFQNLLCQANIAAVNAALLRVCPTCTFTITCPTARQTTVMNILAVGTTAEITALTNAIRMSQVAGVSPLATIENVTVAPNGQVTPAATPLVPQSPSAYIRATTTTSVQCTPQAECNKMVADAGITGITPTCLCGNIAGRQTGPMNIILAPATGIDAWAFARAVADYYKTCVNVYSPASMTVPIAAACNGKGSKKSLLGLLGLLGLIPLLLCCCLFAMCCLRRRKAARDVHFATFDPAPAMAAPVAMAPSVCAAPVAAPMMAAPMCAPASVCAPAAFCP